jgi:hypothetical protein
VLGTGIAFATTAVDGVGVTATVDPSKAANGFGGTGLAGGAPNGEGEEVEEIGALKGDGVLAAGEPKPPNAAAGAFAGIGDGAEEAGAPTDDEDGAVLGAPNGVLAGAGEPNRNDEGSCCGTGLCPDAGVAPRVAAAGETNPNDAGGFGGTEDCTDEEKASNEAGALAAIGGCAAP